MYSLRPSMPQLLPHYLFCFVPFCFVLFLFLFFTDSVFNLLSQSDRAKLKHTTEVLKSGGGGVKDSSSSEIKRSEKRNTEPSTAQQRPDIQSFSASGKQKFRRIPFLLKCFLFLIEMKPFSGDVAKQVRYEAYLAGKSKCILAIMTLNVHSAHTTILRNMYKRTGISLFPRLSLRKLKFAFFQTCRVLTLG